jgi:hypothetical protein
MNPEDAKNWAYAYLAEAEIFAADVTCEHRDLSILSAIASAGRFRHEWSAEEVARGLAAIDTITQPSPEAAIHYITKVEGVNSNLEDECGARLASRMRALIPRDFLAMQSILQRIGPRTLHALLKAGADPNAANAYGSPLARIMRPVYEMPLRRHTIHMVVILVGAGADPAGVKPIPLVAERFAQICTLRSLSAFRAGGKPNRESSPAVRFVAEDGDAAIAQRVHMFLACRELFTLQ